MERTITMKRGRKERLSFAVVTGILGLIMFGALPNPVSAVVSTLFSGGFKDTSGADQWQNRFGNFNGDAYQMSATGVPIDGNTFHAEAQHVGVLGADFTYSAIITIGPNVEGHLQFRISDEGRYGVRLTTGGVSFYRFLRGDKPCSPDASVFTHCPLWPQPGDPCPGTVCQFADTCDNPVYCGDPQSCQDNGQFSYPVALQTGTSHTLSVRAHGSVFDVFLDDGLLFSVSDSNLGVGRFGVYVIGDPASLPNVVFTNVEATTDPTQPSNFALLYSTAGYEAAGTNTKRVLVRTLNDLPDGLFDPLNSRFILFSVDGTSTVVLQGPLRALPKPGGIAGPAKTFGMQLWEADFSSITGEGNYALRVDLATSTGVVVLNTAPFEIRSRLVSQRMLKPLSILNAEARRAADEDMRRNWCFETPNGCTNNPAFRGAWSVALDGAFLADRADAQGGAVIQRVFDDGNAPLEKSAFRYVGRVTIISGCDAQMQFWISESERWAVTLQAGDGGGCTPPGGLGAVRIHREGFAVPMGFETLGSASFPSTNPFRAGQPYDVDIIVSPLGAVWVNIDEAGGQTGVVQLLASTTKASFPIGRFGLKAWGSTVRFERLQAWNPGVHLAKSPGGSRIPYYTDNRYGESCQGSQVVPPLPPDQAPLLGDENGGDVCNPYFSQFHGFHDCNNYIGEATSHGTFLAGLMDLWTRRASTFPWEDRESLRHAIQTTALYLEELFQQAGGTSGEFAHSEMGRGGVDTNLGTHLTKYALYGESAFADKGEFVDKQLARQACQNSLQSLQWFGNALADPTERSVMYARVARCAAREQLCADREQLCDHYVCGSLWNEALNTVEIVLNDYSLNGFMGGNPSITTPRVPSRDTGRGIPWFEGISEVLLSCPGNRNGYQDRLNAIADLLVRHLTREHPCDDSDSGPTCAPNGFFAIPEGSGDPYTLPNIPWYDWIHMDAVPLVDRPLQECKVGNLDVKSFQQGYNVTHFAAATTDMAILGNLADNPNDPNLKPDLERIATGNLYWTLGLNPGVPSSKIVRGTGETPWGAGAFVYNLDAPSPFSRTIQGYRTESSSSKGWMGAWEVSAASPHHETWWIDPLNNGFMSIYNGHMLWDDQWDYWNTGVLGWGSGETFLLLDGAFLKASVLLEDWLAPGLPFRSNPYDTKRVAFFDTTHVDRTDTGWDFDDPDYSLFAQASRTGTGFCDDKAFGGGRFTGHYIGERIGILCVPDTSSFFDATDTEVNATGWGFDDINTAQWAWVSRAATNFCNNKGYVGGFFTGHQVRDDSGTVRRGIVCLGSDAATWFDSTEQDLYNSGEGFDDINTVPWGKGARAATNICLGKGYAGGFFTGHQVFQPTTLRGVVCLGQHASVNINFPRVALVNRAFAVSGTVTPPDTSIRIIIAYTSPSGVLTTHTVFTDGSGFFSDNTLIPNELGPWTIQAHFDGLEPYLDAVSPPSTVVIYGNSSGGSFVIGDGNAAVGKSVTFWGAQWSKLNGLSGGSAPSSFKGFENSPSTLASCGGTWSTNTGGSSGPPSTLPSYMAVIVSDKITKNSSTISGDVKKLVVVKTNPGYAPDPQYAGTGTVVQVICP